VKRRVDNPRSYGFESNVLRDPSFSERLSGGLQSARCSIAHRSNCDQLLCAVHAIDSYCDELPGRLNAALRTSEERLQDIIDNTTAVIFVKDLDLHYLLVNSEFERRHQVQRDQFRGKTDFDIHPTMSGCIPMTEASPASTGGCSSAIRTRILGAVVFILAKQVDLLSSEEESRSMSLRSYSLNFSHRL